MHFVDEAKIYVKAGDGGDGAVAFRREAHVPRGGPSGGDGGDGGSVAFVADAQLSSLLDFKYRQHYRAENGEPGRSKDQYGRAGQDWVVHVPVGTLVKNADTGEPIIDLAHPGQRVVIARGGKGGRGNIHFKTPWHQAPRHAEPGTPGESLTVHLELKLLADVGLLGYPNVGKSTFIAVVSQARPKIADYPFTTLVPHLGVVGLSEGRNFVLADLPGLIEGAAEGAGLGHRFLRHLERTRVLIHLLDGMVLDSSRDPVRDFAVLNQELQRYDPQLAIRPQVVVLNKLDLPDVRAQYPQWKERFAVQGIALWGISAVAQAGIPPLLEHVWHLVRGSSISPFTSHFNP